MIDELPCHQSISANDDFFSQSRRFIGFTVAVVCLRDSKK